VAVTGELVAERGQDVDEPDAGVGLETRTPHLSDRILKSSGERTVSLTNPGLTTAMDCRFATPLNVEPLIAI
jgi:hypothetical protein